MIYVRLKRENNCHKMTTALSCFFQAQAYQLPLNYNNRHNTNYQFLIPNHKFKSFSAHLSSTTTTTITATKLKSNRNDSSKPTLLQPKTPSKINPLHYSSLIQECIDSHSFDRGKTIHAQMVSNGYIPDSYLQTKILMLYARSGVFDDLGYARKLFEDMAERNLTAWNTMLLGYARVNDYGEVLRLYIRMRGLGVLPDKFTFPSVVKACIAMEDCGGVWQVQSLVVKTGLNGNSVVGGTLVDGYARFGWMDDAVTAFDEMEEKGVVTWNAVISGYVKIMKWQEAWKVFYKMQSLPVCLDHFTFATAIRVCGALRSLDQGKQVHSKLIVCGFEGDTFVGNSLIDMYAKCEDDRSSLQVFYQMEQRDQVSWNSMISAATQFKHFDEAFLLFSQMQESGFKSDLFNLGSILMAAAGLADVKLGRELHASLVRNLLDSDVVLGSALVDMYSKCGLVREARKVFDRLLDKNEVSYNALIAGYVLEENVEEALNLYQDMQLLDNIRPDQFTFSTLLTLCADQLNEDHGKQIHAHLIRTCMQNIVIETELVQMYAKCGKLNYARDIFNLMQERNAYSWNSLIEGYEQWNQTNEALQLFQQMQMKGLKPDCFSLASMLSMCTSLSDANKGGEVHAFVIRNCMEEEGILWTMLVDMYAKCGLIDYACTAYNQTTEKDVLIQNVMVSAFVSCGRMNDAKNLFDQMKERNTASWNAILVGYAKSELKEECFSLFQEMLVGDVEIDTLTMVSLFNLCANLPALEHGQQLHSLAVQKGFMNCSVVLETALVDMYAKCGAIEQARVVFDMMNEKNIITWNTMITGYSKHGNSKEALILYERMRKGGIYPNEVTFLSVLSACSHTRMLKEGLTIFISMLEDNRIEAKTEHYNCMVDLLGRVGMLEDAKEVIEKMPVEPDVFTWGALLGASRVHNDVNMGRLAANCLFELDPQNPGHYVLMSNIYAAAGRWQEVEDIRRLMKIKGVKKEPGVSWIEINNEAQIFHAGSKGHPKTEEIYTTLRHLTSKIKQLGYTPDTNFILQNVKDNKEEEEEYFLQHSERLAITLGLISLPGKSTIRVFKNLRICGDCHTAIKLISKLEDRLIIVRDTKRFHHFENGNCSCGDYW